jgi:succinate dehydrogenase flavin-adding protein (antitoxin of CptAB toxin-antitoxin module)
MLGYRLESARAAVCPGRARERYFQMSDASASEPIEIRRKRLIHRSRYTGMKETDLLLGAFAQRYIPGFDAGQLDEYERLLQENDVDLFDWATGRQPVPARCQNAVMRLLQNFKDAV